MKKHQDAQNRASFYIFQTLFLMIESWHMKHFTLFGLFLLSLTLLFSPPKVSAAEIMFFDSTDSYLGACQLTDKSEWNLKEESTVTKFEVWYNWDQGETELPVKLYKDGELFAEFTATRASCDPYQHQWCNADYQINKVFPAGKYSTTIPNSRQCLKPGGTGAIRLYKDDGVTPTAISTITATSTPLPTITTQPTLVTSPTTTKGCSCNTTTIIASSAATSGIVSFLVWLLLKKF